MSSESAADYLGKEVKRSFNILWFFLGGWIYISPWIMDRLYRHIIIPLVGLDKAIRWGRWNVVLQCVLIQAIFCGTLLAIPFGGDPAVFFWGAVFGTWAGVRGGKYVADCLTLTRLQQQMEKPDTPGHFEQPSVVFKDEVVTGKMNGTLTPEDLATFRSVTGETETPKSHPRKPNPKPAPPDAHQAEA